MSRDDTPAPQHKGLAKETRHIRPWMARPGYEALFDALGSEQARFVGGCVRDSLLDIKFSDIDIACQHPPQEALARLEAAGIRALPTGIEHGTITALLPDRPTTPDGKPGWHAVEITSLREDIDTDGRHAKVQFSRSWLADAKRRDLTMNALYLGRDGHIYDPLKTGLIDAKQGRVRFVGDPAQRIREDYLRLLRYFRFAAKYARQPLDEATLATCQTLAPGLERLSGERLQDELFKLLALPSCGPVLAIICQRQILAALWAEPLRLARALLLLERFVEIDSAPIPLLMLRALLGDEETKLALIAKRLRLSNADSQRLCLRPAELSLDDAHLLYYHGRRATLDSLLLVDAPHWSLVRYRQLESLAAPRFPLQGKDLLAAGLKAGPAIGQRLKATEAWWLQGGFHADKAACLAYAQSLTDAP